MYVNKIVQNVPITYYARVWSVWTQYLRYKTDEKNDNTDDRVLVSSGSIFDFYKLIELIFLVQGLNHGV